MVNIKMKLSDIKYKPKKAEQYSAGFDVKARIDVNNCDGKDDKFYIEIKPKEVKIIKTGIFTEIPVGYYADLRPRSGLSFKNKITFNNAVGLIDSSYRNEWGCIVINHSDKSFVVKDGDRIGQFVIRKEIDININIVENLDLSKDRKGGIGSTGIN